MVGPDFSSQEIIDNLNMALFEVSETDNNDPYSFYASVANICRSAGLPLKDADLMNFNAAEYETMPQVCSVNGEAIYLYLAYSRMREDHPFKSHAELVDSKELDEILSLTALNDDDACEDSDE